MFFRHGAIASRLVPNYVEKSVIIVKRRTDVLGRKAEPDSEPV
jgi:hypothetical protein